MQHIFISTLIPCKPTALCTVCKDFKFTGEQHLQEDVTTNHTLANMLHSTLNVIPFTYMH